MLILSPRERQMHRREFIKVVGAAAAWPLEPVIGHMKAEGHLGRCYLKGRDGDAANAVLTAVGYNFRRILAWLRALLCLILAALSRAVAARSVLNPAS